MERPLGLLEKVVVTSCGIKYEHTFAVVDFSKEPNYEIILGRPLMHQMKMILGATTTFTYASLVLQLLLA